MRHSGPNRKVVRRYERPNTADSSLKVQMMELECGHTVRDNFSLYGNERAVQVRRLSHELNPEGDPLRRRCYDCGAATDHADPKNLSRDDAGRLRCDTCNATIPEAR